MGFEINRAYVREAEKLNEASIQCEDFFHLDWPEILRDLPDPVLVVGNPPWVTNSGLGTMRGTNLPAKANTERLSGLDAVTGMSNFDVSEWMIAHLLKSLSGRDAVLAMLCKTTVARKVLLHVWNEGVQVDESLLYMVDAQKSFGVSVDACLLVCVLKPGKTSTECAAYSDLDASVPESTLTLRGGQLVSDIAEFNANSHLFGKSPLTWRSGVKHDCSKVFELHSDDSGAPKNGFGESVNMEPTFLYPMLKSSDLMRSEPRRPRYMLVTQRSLGEDTERIAVDAP